MRKLFILLTVLAMAALTGCSSKLMDPMLDPGIESYAGQSTITFYRPSAFGGAVQAPLGVEIRTDDLALVGISSTKTKIRHVVEPGDHVFVVGGESGSLLKASILPNKHYYVKVSPRFGWAKARFALMAVTPEELMNTEIQELSKCVLVVPNVDADKWFLENKRSMLDKLRVAKEKFGKDENKAEHTLLPEHGVNMLY